MKKLFSMVIMFFLFVGCGNLNNTKKDESDTNIQYYSYIDNIPTSDIATGGMSISVELQHEYTPEYMLSRSDNVVLATIHSIDAADMKYNSVVGYTYGSMQIERVFYGALATGEIVGFAKPGGIIAYDDWNTAQPKAAQEKRAYLQKQENINITEIQPYVDILVEDDIRIEAGKTYLIYLKYSESMEKYVVIGLGNGIREVVGRGESDFRSDDFDSLQVINNSTNKNESLSSYIKQNIPKEEN